MEYKLDITGQAFTEIDGISLDGLSTDGVWELVKKLEKSMDKNRDSEGDEVWVVVVSGGYRFGKDAIIEALKENGYG